MNKFYKSEGGGDSAPKKKSSQKFFFKPLPNESLKTNIVIAIITIIPTVCGAIYFLGEKHRDLKYDQIKIQLTNTNDSLVKANAEKSKQALEKEQLFIMLLDSLNSLKALNGNLAQKMVQDALGVNRTPYQNNLGNTHTASNDYSQSNKQIIEKLQREQVRLQFLLDQANASLDNANAKEANFKRKLLNQKNLIEELIIKLVSLNGELARADWKKKGEIQKLFTDALTEAQKQKEEFYTTEDGAIVQEELARLEKNNPTENFELKNKVDLITQELASFKSEAAEDYKKKGMEAEDVLKRMSKIFNAKARYKLVVYIRDTYQKGEDLGSTACRDLRIEFEERYKKQLAS